MKLLRSHPGPFLSLILLLLSHPLPAAELQSWFYCAKNLWVDKNIDELETLWRSAAAAGYTHVLLTDSKFAKLGDMDARYFRNVERVKKLAADLHLEIVPALFPVGYSNDLLWHDPNLIEGLPVRDASLVVHDGIARLHPELPIAFPGGDFADLKKWSWKDPTVVADNGAALIQEPKGENARIVQKLKVLPFHQYHLQVRVKTSAFRGTPEVKVLGAKGALNLHDLGAKPTQDWTRHHVVFNSLSNAEVNVYFGAWGARSGSLWFDDAAIEEVNFVNLIRRPGAPLVLRRDDPSALVEGTDFQPLSDPLMGTKPYNGSYDVFHEPPLLRVKLPENTRLRASYFHAVTVHDDQAMICPSEPKTLEPLRDQARRMHAAWAAKGYMMSHDEIRVLNWCEACRARNLDAGALLADNVKTCARILRETNPGGRIYVWSDMFDPHHNAHRDYYLVRGDLTGSWEGLDKDIFIVPWYYEKRKESLKFFADRGHRQVIAGYYDSAAENVRGWLDAARPFPGVVGIMYTTWQQKYSDLDRFAELIHEKK